MSVNGKIDASSHSSRVVEERRREVVGENDLWRRLKLFNDRKSNNSYLEIFL